MLTEYLIPLTVALVAVAAVCVLAAAVAWRRASAAGPPAERLAISLELRAITLPDVIASTRAVLAEQGAAAEHALWSIARFDERVERATSALAVQRGSLDALRTRLEGAREGVEKLKSVARLIMRAIELRRAILG